MSDEDWEHREVCPDGACIGVIGGDGLCKVCGRAAPNWGNERLRGLAPEAPDEDSEDEADDEAPDEASSAANDEPGDDGAGGDEWNRRELCANGACIGVIGPNGACTVCGAKPEATA